MILYGSTLSPFVRKTVAYAAEKGIELELRPTGFPNPTPEFRAASPFGKMPALVDGDFQLADSSAIIHYLEAKYPEPQLIPADPREQGKVIWFEEFADTLMVACGNKIFFNRVVAPRFLGHEGDLAVADAAERDELPPLLDYLERVIPASNHLVGDRLTLADLAAAGPFVNLSLCDVVIDSGRYPKVTAFTQSILSRPSFAHHAERDAAALAKAHA